MDDPSTFRLFLRNSISGCLWITWRIHASWPLSLSNSLTNTTSCLKPNHLCRLRFSLFSPDRPALRAGLIVGAYLDNPLLGFPKSAPAQVEFATGCKIQSA